MRPALPFVEEAFEKRSKITGQDLREFAARGLIVAGIENPGKDIAAVTALYREYGINQQGEQTELIWGSDGLIRGKESWKVTTALGVRREEKVIRLATEAVADKTAALFPWQVTAATERYLNGHREVDPTSAVWQAQAEMVHRLGEGGRLGVGVGLAGSGKTSAVLSPLVDAWERSRCGRRSGPRPRVHTRRSPSAGTITLILSQSSEKPYGGRDFQLRSAPIMDGNWHRERVEGDRDRTKSGRYKAYSDGLPAGFIQNDRPPQPITEAERQQLAASRTARAREQAEALQAATAKARDLWGAGLRVQQHLYLTAKAITIDAEAFRRDRKGNLMTAMVDASGEVRNVQTIAPDG